MRFKKIVFLIICTLVITSSNAQSNFTKITGYIGILHPLVTISSEGTVVNFKNNYTVGIPFGINFWKTNTKAFAVEIIPNIKYENGVAKMYNVLFHPGIMFDIGKGYKFTARAAFETAGRYGFTPILTKTIYKAKNNSYYIALGLPARFGNDKPGSIGSALQIGTAF
jgi:hypothetical protein